jgi:hypothetical protein
VGELGHSISGGKSQKLKKKKKTKIHLKICEVSNHFFCNIRMSEPSSAHQTMRD